MKHITVESNDLSIHSYLMCCDFIVLNILF